MFIVNIRGGNALNGLLSFLRFSIEITKFFNKFECQRPERASFISTGKTNDKNYEKKKVSTP